MFRALGLEERVNEIGYQGDFQLIRTWNSGRLISRVDRKGYAERFGAPHMTVHRADLVEALARSLKRTDIRLGARCIAVESDRPVAVARFADGSAIEADAIVGADGLHSVVRSCLFGPQAPHFTGCICYRALVRVEDAPRDIATGDSTMWMGPHGHVVHYRVRRGELLNIVAHYDSDAWTEESWTRECDRSEITGTYQGWHDDLVRLYELGERWYKWALYDRDPLERWSRGSATLLGDSAHAMLPYLGQGACMAIEDGYVLAALIANEADVTAALKTYETLRMPRTRRTVLGSRMRARENHLASPLARLMRDAKFALRDKLGADRTAFQAAWLYEYDVAQDPALQAKEPAGAA